MSNLSCVTADKIEDVLMIKKKTKTTQTSIPDGLLRSGLEDLSAGWLLSAVLLS